MALSPPALLAQTRAKRRELGAQLRGPLRGFLKTEAGSAGLLLAAAVVALVWANSPWSDEYESLWETTAFIGIGGDELSMDLRHWVNDGLMALFFFVIGLEVRHELSVGELTNRRRVVLPAVAAVAGIALPALLYLAVNPTGDARHAWGAVIGTDTAFLLGALAIVGPAMSTQLRVFLLTLTVFDDIVAVSIIGIVYSEAIDPVALAIVVVCLAALALLSRFDQWRAWAYGVVGIVLWIATFESGLHPAIAGMLAGLLIAARPPRREDVERATIAFRAFRQSPLPEVGSAATRRVQQAVSVNERLQTMLHPWASYVVVPVFALANAGVDLRGGVLGDALQSPVMWGVVLGLVVGKTVGIGGGVLIGRRLGLGELPRGVGPGQALGGAALSGIGFTVSLLIVHLALPDPELQAEATVGVLVAALLATLLGALIFRLAGILRGEWTASLPLVLDMPVDPTRDHIRGRPDARLTLVEYGDFECPFCGRATGVVRDLRARFGDDLRYVFRHLPLTDVHPHAELAAAAAEAAGAQGRFWDMHDLLFEHQGELEVEDVLGYAGELGLDVERFARDLTDESLAAHIREDVASAEASGATGTPTFFVAGRRHVGPYDAKTLAHELEASAAAGDPTAA